MPKGRVNHHAECRSCELPAHERLNYFTGRFMTAGDFRAEQDYFLGKHRQHNRYLHGRGTVCGLRVVEHPNPECRDRFVIIEPGLALDCCGREVVVRESVYVDIPKMLSPAHAQQGGGAGEQARHLLISLCYRECKAEFVPALYSECGCDEAVCDANRICEGYEVEVRLVAQLPEKPARELAGVGLEWATTLNIDKASRAAVASAGDRLYVLTSSAPGQLTVFDAANHSLLRTLEVKDTGADLALSPTGQYVYVVHHVAGGQGGYFLAVFDVQDLSAAKLVNDFKINDAQPDPARAPKVAVAEADGRVYVLDRTPTPKKKVTVWKTDLNAEGADPDAAKYAEFETGEGTTDIAVSPDGVWLFLAEAAAADKKIVAAKVETLAGPQTTYTVTPGEAPLLLSVSGDSRRLYAVTADKKVRAFLIEESPSAFPQIGDGADAGPDEAVALGASPSAKWAYLLSRAADGKGSVRAVNGGKFETDAGKAVGDPASAISGPQDIFVARDGARVYVAGEGDGTHSGGVAVFEVSEKSCGEIFWHALEGCPECPEEEACVPLAVVRDYAEGKTINDADIDNRIRPLAPSAETLEQAILCALECACGAAGPKGDKGDPGLPGTQGPPGEQGPGLEAGLTRIQAISWKQGAYNQKLGMVGYPGQQPNQPALIIGFSGEIEGVGSYMSPNHYAFQVFVEDARNDNPQLRCYCMVDGGAWPVREYTVADDDPSLIVSAVWETDANNPSVKGLAFFTEAEDFFKLMQESERVWVRLLGDHIVDKQGRALDAEFTRLGLPTGDRPEGGDYGAQGGAFESWFNYTPDAEDSGESDSAIRARWEAFLRRNRPEGDREYVRRA